MKIAVKEITEEGLDITRSLLPVDLELEDTEIKYDRVVTVTAHITKVGHMVLAKTDVHFGCHSFCARCLEEAASEEHFSMDFDYTVDATTEFIDLGNDIRQEIILRTPMRLLCKDDCHGICPHCGANLNNAPCHCAAKKEEGPLAEGLKHWQKENKE